MNLLSGLKLDKWYGITLYLGVMCLAVPFFKQVDFLNSKHVFGLGIGLVTVSLSFFIADKHVSWREPGAIVQTRLILHDGFTTVLKVIGIVIIGIFLSIIVVSLLK